MPKKTAPMATIEELKTAVVLLAKLAVAREGNTPTAHLQRMRDEAQAAVDAVADEVGPITLPRH